MNRWMTDNKRRRCRNCKNTAVLNGATRYHGNNVHDSKKWFHDRLQSYERIDTLMKDIILHRSNFVTVIYSVLYTLYFFYIFDPGKG